MKKLAGVVAEGVSLKDARSIQKNCEAAAATRYVYRIEPIARGEGSDRPIMYRVIQSRHPLNPACEPNDKSRAGQKASAEFKFGQFRTYAVHTRFDSVQWFTVDDSALLTAHLDGGTAVVRQCDTFAEAIRGL